jgi:hypothetical protein
MYDLLYNSGGSVVIPPKFSASTFWTDFLATKCNWYSGMYNITSMHFTLFTQYLYHDLLLLLINDEIAVPTIHQILLQYESSPAARSLPPSRGRGGIRFIRSCSSALAPATFQQLEDTFGVPVVYISPSISLLSPT